MRSALVLIVICYAVAIGDIAHAQEMPTLPDTPTAPVAPPEIRWGDLPEVWQSAPVDATCELPEWLYPPPIELEVCFPGDLWCAASNTVWGSTRWAVDKVTYTIAKVIACTVAVLKLMLSWVGFILISIANWLVKFLTYGWAHLYQYIPSFFFLIDWIKWWVYAVAYFLWHILRFVIGVIQLIPIFYDLVASILIFILRIVYTIVMYVAYTAYLVTSVIQILIVEATTGTVAPAVLQSCNHFAYGFTRGFLDAWHDDPRASWMFYLTYTMAYIGLITWIVRLFAEKDMQ